MNKPKRRRVPSRHGNTRSDLASIITRCSTDAAGIALRPIERTITLTEAELYNEKVVIYWKAILIGTLLLGFLAAGYLACTGQGYQLKQNVILEQEL